MREALRRNRGQETGETILRAVAQAIGYIVLTGAAVWMLYAYA